MLIMFYQYLSPKQYINKIKNDMYDPEQINFWLN